MNTLDKPIKYILEDLQQEFEKILTEFSREIGKEESCNILGEDLVKQVTTQIKEIANHRQEDFSLVVVGDFKRGKSTLVNALLGKKIVTTKITPETISINKIKYGTELKVEVCLSDGGIIELQPEELDSTKLLPIIESTSHQVSHLNIEAPIEWLKGLCLVDTPGTGDIFKRFDTQVHDYLRNADAVLFIISALSPLSLSERAFLKLSVLPHDFPKIIFIVNMMDLVHSCEEVEQLLDSLQMKISNLFPQAQIFGISAFDEFCRLQSLPRRNQELSSYLAVNFQRFREHLEESILLNRDIIQLNRMTQQMLQMLQHLEKQICLLHNGIALEESRLIQAISLYEDESSELFTSLQKNQQFIEHEINKLLDETIIWMNEFLERLEQESLSKLNSFEKEDLHRHYPFFLNQSLNQAINSCLNTHRSLIYKIGEQALQSVAEDFSRLTKINVKEQKISNITINQQEWRTLETLQLVMNFTPFKLITDLIINQMRESTQSSQITNYQQKLRQELPELKLAVIKKLQVLYQEIAIEISQEVETYYRREIETSLSALKQARELSNQEAQKRKTITKSLEDIIDSLGNHSLALQNLQQKLWTNKIFS